jgi:hypothetical protein
MKKVMGHENDYEVVASADSVTAEFDRKLVVVPEWSMHSGKSPAYWVHELDGTEYDAYQSAMFKMGKGSNYTMSLRGNMLRLLTYCLRDANGHHLYPTTDEGIKKLGQKPQGGLDRLSTMARKLNGLAKSDDDENEAVKNSEGDRDFYSSTGSPLTSSELVESS